MRIPIKENKEPIKNQDKNTSNLIDNKFQQKIQIKNARELIQKYPTKEKLSNEYLKEHFKDNESSSFRTGTFSQLFFRIASFSEQNFNRAATS